MVGWAGNFISEGLGQETVLFEIVFGARESADAAPGAVVVGQDEAVGRNERSGATPHASGREPDLVQPVLIDFDPVLVLDGLAGNY